MQSLGLSYRPCDKSVSMASSSSESSYLGLCDIDIELNQSAYSSVQFGILGDLCNDMILGYEFQKQYMNVVFSYGGQKDDFVVSTQSPTCALTASSMTIPSLFSSAPADAKPIATKSRRFGSDEQTFIDQEVAKLLKEGIIEPSFSPWRAQVVVAKDLSNTHKKRLCIDYSRTINLYTHLDAYPMPRIDDMLDDLAKYRVFSTFDLRSAYHQVSIIESDKKFTAFEAGAGCLAKFSLPFQGFQGCF